jgi:hypothetical protein
MADQEVALRIKADAAEAVKTVGNIKKELREAQREAVNISAAFGETSKEALDAAKKVALLKDQIADTNERVALFDPGAKFAVFGNVLRTVAGGFSALTGAVALFGVQSEEVEKTLLKVQAALAITEGINTIADAGKDFQRLSAFIGQTTIAQKALAISTTLTSGTFKALGVSVATSSTAFKVLRTAIITTGIGALVVGVGLLIEKLSSLTSSTDSAAAAQDRLKEATERANQAFADQVGFIDRENQLNIKRAKARGEGEAEITALERKAIQDRITLRNKEITNRINSNLDIADLTKANLTDINALQDFDLDLEIKRTEKRKQLQEKAAQDAKAAREKEQEEQKKKAEEAEKSRLDFLKAQQELAIASRDQFAEDNAEFLEQAKEQQAAEAQSQMEAAMLRLELQENVARQQDELRQKELADELAKNEAIKISREQLAQASINAIGALADLVGRQTKAGKVLALAEIAAGTAIGLINGLDIAQKTAKGTGPAAAFAFPIFYATQIAAVLGAASRAKAVLSSGNTSGGGGASVSTPSPAAVRAPAVPQNAITGQTTLDANSLNQIGNATTRAFVVEADVANNMERVTRLNRAARLG